MRVYIRRSYRMTREDRKGHGIIKTFYLQEWRVYATLSKIR